MHARVFMCQYVCNHELRATAFTECINFACLKLSDFFKFCYIIVFLYGLSTIFSPSLDLGRIATKCHPQPSARTRPQQVAADINCRHEKAAEKTLPAAADETDDRFSEKGGRACDGRICVDNMQSP